MKPHRFVLFVLIAACSSSSESPGTVGDTSDGSAEEVATDSGGDAGTEVYDSATDAGGCTVVHAVPSDGSPDCNCDDGSVCVFAPGAPDGGYAFCAPMAAGCEGVPTCECMGYCACESITGEGCATVNDVGIQCVPWTSRRDRKRDIHYIDEEERAGLAARALSVPLATYQYKTDAPDARRRLGFIIEDQANPSFAVDDDRTHVDLYGYASMLLATVQQQHEEIEALKKRVATLEAR